MNGYTIALFIHLAALVAASAASALVHLADVRRSRATSVSEARQWHALAASTARVFPIAVLVLFASGGYMISAGHGWSWSTGWVDAGIAGVVVLMVNGAMLGRRGRAAARELAELASAAAATHAGAIPRDPLASTLAWANTGLAVAVVFVMTTKPTLVGSLIVLAIGIAAGVLLARSTEPRAELVEETTAG